MTEPSNGELWKKWLRQWWQSANGKLQSGKVQEKLQKNLEETFQELSNWLAGRQESKEIAQLCGEVTHGDVIKKIDMKELCKGMVEIRYFISGVKTERMHINAWSDKEPIRKKLDDEEAYKRCVVGMLAMFEFYKDHCKLEEVIKEIEGKVNDKLRTHSSKGATFDGCKGITIQDLIIGKTLVADKIKTWALGDKAKADRTGGHGGARRVGQVIWVSEDYCKKEKPKQKPEEQLNKNLENITTFLGLGDNSRNPNLLDILMKKAYTLSDEEFETALKPATNGKGDIEQAIKKLEEKIQQKIPGNGPPPPPAAPQALTQPPIATSQPQQQQHAASPNNEGILATLASALSDPTTTIPALAGAMALPAVLSALFLYKKHKRSGSGRSGRRKRSLRREYYGFDDDDDDTFTETYSRTNLTATSTNSSEYSIPYTSSSSSSSRSSSSR